MAALPPIDDSNTYATKTEGGDVGEPTDLISAVDLNALKARISENRSQANLALAAAEAAVVGPASAVNDNIATFDGTTGLLVQDGGQSISDLTSAIGDKAEPSGATTDGNLTQFGASSTVLEDSGVPAAAAFSATFPLVQAAHTSATKTLAAGDANTILPMNAGSNAIEVTIPHTLFAAGGTGRAFVCVVKVTSVAGGALTFVGSGGITIDYHGKDPGSDAYVAGDWLTIVVDSATTASIFASEAL